MKIPVGEGLRQDIMDAAKGMQRAELKQLNSKERKVLNLVVHNKPIQANDKIILDTLEGRLSGIKKPREGEVSSHPKFTTMEKIQKKLGVIVSSAKLEKGIAKAHGKEELAKMQSDEGAVLEKFKSRPREEKTHENEKNKPQPTLREHVSIKHPQTESKSKTAKHEVVSKEKEDLIHKLAAEGAEQFDISKWEKPKETKKEVMREEVEGPKNPFTEKERKELEKFDLSNFQQPLRTNLLDKKGLHKVQAEKRTAMQGQKKAEEGSKPAKLEEGSKLHAQPEHRAQVKSLMMNIRDVGPTGQKFLNGYLAKNKCFKEVYEEGRDVGNKENRAIAKAALRFASEKHPETKHLTHAEQDEASKLSQML